MKIYEFLDEESKFCRGNFSILMAGSSPLFTNPGNGPEGTCYAVKWDMIGAAFHCYQDSPKLYAEVYTKIYTSQKIKEWVQGYLKGLDEKDYKIMKQKYGADWPLFNDLAPFNEIQLLLKELNI